jgi:hypothetical protein
VCVYTHTHTHARIYIYIYIVLIFIIYSAVAFWGGVQVSIWSVYDSVRREVLYSNLTECGIPMKLVRLIK